jgi:phage terminase large subunit GpA-like protein
MISATTIRPHEIREISRSSAVELRARISARCYAFSSLIPPEDWAQDIYRLPTGGRFRWEFAPYTRAMFKSIFDRNCIETSMQLFSRGLKSTVILLAIGYVIDQAPRRILSLWPTNGQGEKWSKDNLCGELLNCTPALNYLGNATGKRTTSNTLSHKEFPGGLIDIFGANSPGDMRRAKGSFLYADEIDAIGTEQTDEGDQLAIFNKRGDEYPDTIRVFSSYPSVIGLSRINSRLKDSDHNEWHSTCADCGGEPFIMHRSQLRYETSAPEGARLECPRCSALLTDRQRYDMAHRQGFDNWRPRNAFRGKRGFQANALLWPHPVDEKKYPGGLLQCLAQQEIDAKQSDNPKRSLRVLVNTVDAEPFDPTEESEKPPDWQRLYNLRENYTLAPKAVSLITCFVDIQNNRLELEWKGWARDEQSWGLDYLVLDGNPLDIQPGSVWHRLMTELQRKFKREDGAELELSMCFVDAGKWGDWAFQAYRLSQTFPKLMGKFMLSKGVGQQGAPINPRKMASIHRNIKGIPIGAWAGKDLIYTRLRLDPNADGTFVSGYMHHPMSYDANYFQQLTSDSVVMEYKGGEEVRRYGNNEGKRDEALDCAYGNLAVFMLRRWNFDALEADLAQTRPDAPAQAAPSAWFSAKAQGGWNL